MPLEFTWDERVGPKPVAPKRKRTDRSKRRGSRSLTYRRSFWPPLRQEKMTPNPSYL
jgi:hypothetical protein